jgi:hypothetical protein
MGNDCPGIVIMTRFNVTATVRLSSMLELKPCVVKDPGNTLCSGVVSSVTFLLFTSRMTTAFPHEIAGFHGYSFRRVPERVQNLSGNSGYSSTPFRNGIVRKRTVTV